MSFTLPTGIETYLRESGFSSTEIIVIRKLLEENLLTVRELSIKTGKGNGVIDSALKKLVRRGIVAKENINESPKYCIIDPQVIVSLAQKNLKEHVETMERKHQNFAQFMKNLSVAKTHPQIEHFSGDDGLIKAYNKLLENRAELLTYLDPESISSDDVLNTFRTQFFRRRQVYGVFQRVIAPDSVMARRFRSRDPFEYRQTLLVPAPTHPVSFEKIIADDVVACIDIQCKEASFIHFPKLAESERNTFERLWAEELQRDRAKQGSQPAAPKEQTLIPLRDRLTINTPQKITLFAFCSLLIFWAALFLTGTRETLYNNIYAFLFGCIPFFSGLIAMYSAKMWGWFKNSIGKAVFFTGLGIFLWGLGSMIWCYYIFFKNIPAPYPSIADFAFAPSIFFYALGIIYLSDATGAKLGLKSIYAKIFVIAAPPIILALSYYTLIFVARNGVFISGNVSKLKMVLDVVYPLGDFIGLTAAVLISGLSFHYMRGRYTLEIVTLLAGLAVMFIGDFVFSYTTTVGTFYNGNYGDLILMIGTSLLSFGALGFVKDKERLLTT